MATSGTIITTTTAKEIIQEALELLGALGEGELANSAQETSLLRTLRNLCTTWQADGLNLFAVTSLTLFLTPGESHYRMPGTIAGTKVTRRRTVGATLTGNTTILLGTATDADEDWCGVMLEDNTMHWSAIVSRDATSVTLQSAVPLNVNTAAPVFTFTKAPDHRFMKALHGSYKDFSGTDIPMEAMSRNEYDSLTRKDSTGIPLQYYVDTQATYNDIFIWPTATRADQSVRLDVQRQLDSVTGANVDVAFPAEWFLPLATSLAWVSSAKYGLPPDDTRRLQTLAATYYAAARDFDFEWGTSIYLEPDHT